YTVDPENSVTLNWLTGVTSTPALNSLLLSHCSGGGCGLMARTNKFQQIVRGMHSVLDVPLTVKIRTGVQQNCNIAHKLIPELKKWGVSMITLHGRSREQRYTKLADWSYIDTCSKLSAPVPLFGNVLIYYTFCS
ncbi:tRNA-dihydrouridine(47) synthase [NAD(P)(+)]-like isoform X1, partial [Tachysurus ichikawai]